MHRTGTVEDILRTGFPRAELTPAAHSVIRTLLGGDSALLVAPDPWERELAWQIAARAGLLPVLVVATSERGLEHRAERLAHRLDLITCHIHARMPDRALAVLAEQFADGKWDAAFVSGRGLSDPRMMSAARALAPRLLVVEDAHRISVHGWRYDPAWRLTADVAARAESVLALSDLADADTRAEIVDCLAADGCEAVLSGLDRPELRIEGHRAPTPPQMDAHLLGLFPEPRGWAIIHANEQVEAERLAEMIREERGLDAQDVTNLDPHEFAAVMRRFREGGLRVLVDTGHLTPAADWPAITVAASFGVPESVELLHRRLFAARGDDARAVVIYAAERDEAWPRLERRALAAAPDSGHLLAVHEAAASGEELSYAELSRRTGLPPGAIDLALGALIEAGAIRPVRRGDDWLRAEAGTSLPPDVLDRWARQASEMRMLHLRRAEAVPEFVRSRRCRREGFADALDYPLVEGDCNCDRCRPETPLRIAARRPGGYPLKIGGFRGWALALYRRPGDERPTQGPGRLIERLKYAGDEGCGRRLAWLLHRRVRESRTYRDCDVIVPVPPSRDADDAVPSVLLAREVGRLSELPVAMALRSARERRPQKELTSTSSKKANIAGAFEVTSAELIDGSIVLLVDDIFDSGATMQEAARELVRAGAADVRLLTAVRTAFGWRRGT